MKKAELAKICEAAKAHYEESIKWFGYAMEAEDEGRFDYAETCKRISNEHENKAKGMSEIIEMLTGYYFASWSFVSEYTAISKQLGF